MTIWSTAPFLNALFSSVWELAVDRSAIENRILGSSLTSSSTGRNPSRVGSLTSVHVLFEDPITVSTGLPSSLSTGEGTSFGPTRPIATGSSSSTVSGTEPPLALIVGGPCPGGPLLLAVEGLRGLAPVLALFLLGVGYLFFMGDLVGVLSPSRDSERRFAVAPRLLDRDLETRDDELERLDLVEIEALDSAGVMSPKNEV